MLMGVNLHVILDMFSLFRLSWGHENLPIGKIKPLIY